MTTIRRMIHEFQLRDIPAEWWNTGGGCMAVRIGFGPRVPDWSGCERYEILITTPEGPFSRPDYGSDSEIPGLYAGLYVFDESGDIVSDEPAILYRSSDDLISASEFACGDENMSPPVVDLLHEMAATVEAVAFWYDRVMHADHIGRSTASRSRHWYVNTPEGVIVCEVCMAGLDRQNETW